MIRTGKKNLTLTNYTVPTKKDLRLFGLILGIILMVIGAWPMVWRQEGLRLWAIIPAGILVVLGIMLPSMLTPIHKIWMKIGAGLGWINTRI